MPIAWERRGLLIGPGAGLPDFSHASHPIAVEKGGDNFFLVFSMRDSLKRSSLFVVDFTIEDRKIRLTSGPRLALSPGPKGTFDSEGLLGCSAVSLHDRTLIFYTGWNNLGDGAWLCDTGLAEIDLDSGEIARRHGGPVMSRGVDNPLFAAGTSVIFEDGRLRSWYNRGLEWIQNPEGESVCKYGVFYAESPDGIHWRYSGTQSIPFADQFEHSFGRPCVIKLQSGYHMWFGARGGAGNPEYRMGYANSQDGFTWSRRDELAGMNPTGIAGDFDSTATTYPYVIQHEGLLVMFYNGDRYGASGIGYAVGG